LKEKVWGGRRLESLLGKVLPGSGPYGESWEVADCDGDRSLVDGGPWDGLDLHALVAAHPEAVLGRRGAEFPLLLKTIDASDWLSVQLHPAGAPGEVGARDGGPAPRKKTEAWIILDAPPGARIIYGLADGVERERFFDTALSGAGERIQTLLGWREVRAGDVVFLPPGTIHAIGPGILLLEVQENSDTTYRIYDWDRPGLDGRPRGLHLAEARSVAPPSGPIPCPYVRLEPPGQDHRGGAETPLIDCEPFRIDALRLPAGRPHRGSTGRGEESRFLVLGGFAGSAVVSAGEGEPGVEVRRGEFLLLPAALGDFTVTARPGGFTGLWVREGNTGRIGRHE